MKSTRLHEFRSLVPQLKNHLYGGEMKAFQHMMDSSVSESISSLEKHSNESGKFDNVIDILKRVGGKRLYEIIKDELIYDKTDVWNIICHGKYFSIFLIFLFVSKIFIHSWINFCRATQQAISGSTISCSSRRIIQSKAQSSWIYKCSDTDI